MPSSSASSHLIYNAPTVYDVSMPLQLNGAPFGTIRVGVSTVFLKNEITPSAAACGDLFGAGDVGLSVDCGRIVAYRPWPFGANQPQSRQRHRRRCRRHRPRKTPASDEYGLVTLKIAHLGRQMRDAKEIFSALKDNVDQIMANLQDGLMLFTGDSRVVLVSASVERFLSRPRRDLLGKTVKEIFSPDTQLGALILEAFQLSARHRATRDRVPDWPRCAAFPRLHPARARSDRRPLILRDAESVRKIEDEIEISRRLSASGRLTRGVAHEVKNPINAIVLHLQLLQTKLQQIDPDTRRHMDIIDNEIHRLDRVVQILVDFTRPRDLHLENVDLRRMVDEVVMLATPDAAQHGVEIRSEVPDSPLPVRVDTDFMKQAILNVVINGVQAMPEGGRLTISTKRMQDSVITEITDQGAGIPHEIQEKIFELYFTTKKEGSGIGLAQTLPGAAVALRLRRFRVGTGPGHDFPPALALGRNACREFQTCTRTKHSRTPELLILEPKGYSVLWCIQRTKIFSAGFHRRL